MTTILDAEALNAIFLEARTHYSWLPTQVSDGLLVQLYNLAKFAPTSSNGSPMRVVFVRTPEGKARLKPALAPGNVEKVMTAPVTAIIAYDPKFFEHLAWLSPHSPTAGKIFSENHAIAERAAFRNGALQGAYMIIAARAVGLDCGPMSGFKHDIVDQEFFAKDGYKSNFLLNLGYGDKSKLWPRQPRFEFDEVCSLA